MTYTREFRIETRHIAALIWDAMFRSRSATFDWSNNKSVQKVRDLFRFQKEQFVVVLYRKKMNDLAYLN